jgi:hypothetical protein
MKKIILISIFFCLIISTFSTIGLSYDLTEVSKEYDSNNNNIPDSQLGDEPVSKQLIIGRIRDLETYDDTFFGDVTLFTVVRGIAIQSYRYNESKAFGFVVIKELPMFYILDTYQFKGILRDNFIFGVWELI